MPFPRQPTSMTDQSGVLGRATWVTSRSALTGPCWLQRSLESAKAVRPAWHLDFPLCLSLLPSPRLPQTKAQGSVHSTSCILTSSQSLLPRDPNLQQLSPKRWPRIALWAGPKAARTHAAPAGGGRPGAALEAAPLSQACVQWATSDPKAVMGSFGGAPRDGLA